jgi:hypothetical protein
MLDATTPLAVPNAEVLAWADLDSPDVVWALPGWPRLAVDADGLPNASVLLYRRGKNSPPDGGQLNLTVDLKLTDAEREAAARAGAANRPPPRPGDPDPPPVEVGTPQWVEATVHAELLPGLTAAGTPSLLGDNACVLALQLDAAQAAAVQDAWDAGFPDATVALDGVIEGAGAAAASAHTTQQTTHQTDRQTSTYSSAFAVAAAARTSMRVPLQLRGPLRLPPEARSARRTDLTL